ncbi:hypothetical protein ACSNOI_33545, partial [Actinomadura kijaniata]|uniref:hypothetical protein n=1 Tax=Actinomadura kijaniata TaxID=46161 RepID=UPI003F1E3A83
TTPPHPTRPPFTLDAMISEGRSTTARLHGIPKHSARAVIVEGSPDKVGSADLSRLLAIVDGGGGDRCRCVG